MNRLFLALRAQLNDYIKLRSDFMASIKGRWVADENLHLTLCYFGDDYEVDELLEKLPEVVETIEPLPLISLGYLKYNNILFAKVKSKKLEELQASVCTHLSLPNAKLFIPHVTLIRIKEIQNKKAFKEMLKTIKVRPLVLLKQALSL